MLENIHRIEKIKSFTITVALLIPISTNAQIVISSGSGWKAFETVDVSSIVEDSESHEPLFGASAFLQIDTVITHFSLSNEKGIIIFKDIPKGKYRLCIESLGYLPYWGEYSIMSANDIPKKISLQVDTLFLDAATITGYSTPVYQVNDTLVYNAVAFQTGRNAVLEDLIKKMPGLEVTNGQVTANGVPVNSITIEGKTFFFADPSIAIKNLPARIVEKIRVFDQVSDGAGSVETALGKKDERVMDIELNDEFKKGSFGNLALSGGAGSTLSVNPANSKTKTLYETRLVGSSYNEKDQVVALAVANNLLPANGWNRKLAVNANSTRIKNLDNTIAIVASYDKKAQDLLASRNYYLNKSVYSHSVEKSIGQTSTSDLDVNIESKIKGNLDLTIKPSFNHEASSYVQENSKRLIHDGNESFSYLNQIGHNSSMSYGLSLQGGIHSLNKDGRCIQFKVVGKCNMENGTKRESSDLLLDYVLSINRLNATSSIIYTEPILGNLDLNVTADIDYALTDNVVTATNAETNIIENSFSSISKSGRINSAEALFLTWKPKGYMASIGGQFLQDLNDNTWGAEVNHSRKWRYILSPFLNVESYDGSKQFYMSSRSAPAQDIQLRTSLARTGSADILIGNPYLRPSTFFSATANYYKTKHIQVLLDFQYDKHAIVNATWFSHRGSRYSFPVNSRHPKIILSPFINYYLYFTEDKRLYMYFNINGSVNFEHSYQAAVGPEVDEETFNFSEFIERYWGNEDGDIFYNGLSGFIESTTFTCNMNSQVNLIYRNKTFTATLHLSPSYYGTRYTLIPDANETVWKWDIGQTFDFRLPKGFALSSEFKYVLYKGYGEGLDRDIWDLSFELNKDIGSFALAIKCNDAFNQSVNLSHVTSHEYVQNTIQSCLGRTVMFSLGYLFGKGNAARERSTNRFVRDVTR